MEVFPNYYSKFSCVADKCKHSCCVGWEIDIDDDTLDLYNSLDTEMGEKIRANIEGDPPHFILKEGDRCPFLNKCGLCDIILTYGEGALSDICTLHPRFKNFYEAYDEVGLGLCCEEAVRVILGDEEKFKIEIPDCASDTERKFLKLRDEIFSILQDRERDMLYRFENLAKKFDLKCEFSLSSLKDQYLKLERLDENWTNEILKVSDETLDKSIFNKYPLYFEQLAVYFIFRHLQEDCIRETVNFSLMSCYFLGAMWSQCEDKEKMFELVRMYSSEIEYSEENLEIMRGSLYAER